MEFEDPEIIQEFVVESAEHLADIENQLLTIEEAGANIDIDLVNTVFRGVHSIKGAAGFLALTTINKLAHSLENVLNLMRERALVPTTATVDVMLRSADQLRTLLENVSESNSVDVGDFIVDLDAVAAGTYGEEQEVTEDDEIEDVELNADDSLAAAEALIAAMEASGTTCIQSMPTPAKKTKKPAAKRTSTKKPAAKKAAVSKPAPKKAPARKSAAKAAPVASSLAAGPPAVAEPAPEIASPSAVPATIPDPKPVQELAAATKVNAESNIRVSVESLDRLMNLAGELVLGRNQLLQTIATGETSGLEAVANKINQVTCEMQDAIMQTRMQPIGNVFTRFTRVVRDLSAKLGKQCQLDIQGKEVEVDKTIVEAIADPLTHLVRNAVDHGLEMPAVRQAKGKPSQGNLRLRAFHQSGKVCIEISDDGAGINVDVIKSKAVEKGLISQDQATSMSDRDAYRLIFMPGFSTAEKLSDVSGRGVGMDVVRTNIERLGGTVEVSSKLGAGTKIEVTLPLTLAIIPSLIVRASEDRFAIPQANIVELVRVRGTEVANRIGRVKDAEVLRLRGSLLPLVRLGDVLVVKNATNLESSKISDGAINIIVVETGQLRYGIIVDGLFDSEEIVVKPLGHHLKNCRSLSGATILGDGRVALILDISGISQHAELGTSNDVAACAAAADAESENVAGDTQRLLLFDNSPGEQFAVPMGLVSRIERIKLSQTIRVGEQMLLQYPASTLPLLCLEDHIESKPRNEQDRLFVVVFETNGREVGLVAPILHDVRSVTAVVDDTTLREPGVIGSLVIDGTATRLLDMFELVLTAHPDWCQPKKEAAGAEALVTRILLAEDSKFFRNQVKKHLVANGYEITEADDGQEAWEKLSADPDGFDLVVTDIQMPRMDGFEFCATLKGDSRTAHVPVIALTSLAGDEDVRRGQECGVDDYQVKMDREKLLAAVERLKPKSTSASRRPLQTVS
ncbi:Chemotaxis protein CheA [Rubripirellula tenax]|uniref:histidine kinase n=1 Tax=Rubripirellula tenax TaxID=2528015 RepID=A0A5C6FDK2_9BACT|nr:chemotaxis protein CheW [Rubripirellula tenax]TWU58737.1 Chemotaxis protein CheA [Rubripirellula tenax]